MSQELIQQLSQAFEMANDDLKAEIAALKKQEQPSKTERQIRRMLCIAVARGSPYMDDGEAQDNSMFPCIDFMRDSPEQIHSKLMERAIAKHKAQQEQRINVPAAHELAKELAKTDQTVTTEYLAWLESLYPARNGVGGNEAWNAGIAWFKAQQEQPASVDAYVGAREDAAIWKKRALEAEELNRKFIAEVNGPTYLGEPAQQEQPAQETCWCDQNNIGEPGVSCGDCPTRDYKQPALSDLIELAKVYSQQYASPHHIVFSVDGLRHLLGGIIKTIQPAMSDAEIRKYFDSENGLENCSMCHLDDFTKVYRAIEAHCRGGAK